METKMWKTDEQSIKEAAQSILNGEVVAFPTETVYGLGADATNEHAIAKIFQAKGRPADNPLIVHVDAPSQIGRYVQEIPEAAQKLIDHFMPGPFTIILKNNKEITPLVTAGLDSVGIRIPNHPIARAFIQATGKPIAAPSANLSGKPSPTKANHVLEDLKGKISGVIEGGATGVGLESTVVDATGEIPIILRPGNVTLEDIKKIVPSARMTNAIQKQDNQSKSPGMKYNHYEPDAPLYVVHGDSDFFQKQIDLYRKKHYKVGVLASDSLMDELDADQLFPCGENDKEIAAKLYDGLRYFNHTNVDLILAEAFSTDGVGQAIMNRLSKAASDHLYQTK